MLAAERKKVILLRAAHVRLACASQVLPLTLSDYAV